jgi:hypothetical protein
VNKALCILYARHVLSRLLSEWPDDRELTSEVLDSGDEVQLIGILDLLQRIETKEAFETVGIVLCCVVLCCVVLCCVVLCCVVLCCVVLCCVVRPYLQRYLFAFVLQSLFR